tara:strand:- start:464 stop:931 length:468 start_codon:yes stop_codon:yes gene_type:complete
MNRLFLFLAPIIVFFTTSAAHADWQYTTWGSSADEVMAASSGAAQENSDRGKDPGDFIATLVAPYQGLGYDFDAYFIFDQADRLQYVDLEPRNSLDCEGIRSAILNSYGKPEQTGSFGLMKWWHQPSENVVVFSEIIECKIRYMQLSEPGVDSGL